MNRYAFVLVSLLMLGSAVPALAHAPTSATVTMAKVEKKSLLVVRVLHAVDDPRAHGVRTIRLVRDGKTFVEQHWERQAGTKAQRAVFLVPDLKVGDTLTVVAICSKGQKFEKDVVVREARRKKSG